MHPVPYPRHCPCFGYGVRCMPVSHCLWFHDVINWCEGDLCIVIPGIQISKNEVTELNIYC
jgi:hypothetical protein